jgi:uncharacterized repeat protein (TIGR02543 family)
VTRLSLLRPFVVCVSEPGEPYVPQRLSNVTFSGNKSERDGGGMYNTRQSSSMLLSVSFINNEAVWGGGMFNTDGSNPTVTNVTFQGNQASNDGGAMCNWNSDPTLTNVTFSGNQAHQEGGGMWNIGNRPTLTNVIFQGNQAGCEGGGMYNWDSSPTLTNVTFSGNRADEEGGGMWNGDSNPTVVNAILWANSAPAGPQIHSQGTSTPLVTYSDVEGGYSGQGNVNADPLFADPIAADHAPTTAGDYRLLDGSPAVDAGTNDAVTAATDVDGNPRIADGTGDGSAIVDMGAYEAQIPLLTIVKQGEGLVTSTPGSLDCGSVCSGRFLTGTPVTLTATPDAGWTFAGWSGDLTGSTNPDTVVMDADRTVTVTFAATISAPMLFPVSNPDGDGNYVVDWSDVVGADAYTLEEDDEPGFTSPATPHIGGASQYVVSGQDPGTWYYRVKASNAHGYSAWSSVRSVAVGAPEHQVCLPFVLRHWPPIPATPTLHAISNPDGDGSYTVAWNAADRATSYALQEATKATAPTAGDFSEIYTGPSTSRTISGRGAARYHYRVKARNNWGDSAWSNVASVDVLWEAEPNDHALPEANGPIVSGLTYYGTFPSGADEKDYYTFDLLTAHTVEIWLTHIPAGHDYDLALYDDQMNRLAWSHEAIGATNTS